MDEIMASLAAFLHSERNKGAKEGLAYELAASLLDEATEGCDGCFKNLPPLKQALLDYVTHEFMSELDAG